MSQLRLNPLTGRWVTVAVDREHRPGELDLAASCPSRPTPTRPCPFCPGNEEATPAGARDLRPPGRLAGAGRAQPLPGLRGRRAAAGRRTWGRCSPRPSASGIHEVLVFSPDHSAALGRPRRRAGRGDDGRHPRPHGGPRPPAHDPLHAGHRQPRARGRAPASSTRTASCSASRSCPGEIAEEEAGFRRFEGSCLLCTTLEAEEAADHRVVYADERVVVVCPFWSGTPYEMLVLPRAHEVHLTDAAPADVAAVGRAMRDALARLRAHVWRRRLQPRVPHRPAPPRRARSTGTSTCCPGSPAWPGSSRAPGVMINIVAPGAGRPAPPRRRLDAFPREIGCQDDHCRGANAPAVVARS